MMSEDELAGYATLASRLQGHETPGVPGADFGPSGSLGILLSYGVAPAIVAASATARGGRLCSSATARTSDMTVHLLSPFQRPYVHVAFAGPPPAAPDRPAAGPQLCDSLYQMTAWLSRLSGDFPCDPVKQIPVSAYMKLAGLYLCSAPGQPPEPPPARPPQLTRPQPRRQHAGNRPPAPAAAPNPRKAAQQTAAAGADVFQERA
jgi:hypothetical protein